VENHLVPIRREIAEMAERLFDVIGIPFEQTSELQRQLLAAFAFGMTFAIGQLNRLSPPEVHALAIWYLTDVFRYANHQAVAFAENLIAAASDRNQHPTMNAIIHRGIDGHRQWQQREELHANLDEMFSVAGAWIGRDRTKPCS
jgi:Immunity protein 48